MVFEIYLYILLQLVLWEIKNVTVTLNLIQGLSIGYNKTMEKQPAVYIMTNYLNSTFYIGVTNNLLRRVCEHKAQTNESFSSKYNLNKLVYFELTDNIEDALNREKQLKNWKRKWKIELIQKENTGFNDLSKNIGFSYDLMCQFLKSKLIDSE